MPAESSSTTGSDAFSSQASAAACSAGISSDQRRGLKP